MRTGQEGSLGSRLTRKEPHWQARLIHTQATMVGLYSRVIVVRWRLKKKKLEKVRQNAKMRLPYELGYVYTDKVFDWRHINSIDTHPSHRQRL